MRAKIKKYAGIEDEKLNTKLIMYDPTDWAVPFSYEIFKSSKISSVYLLGEFYFNGQDFFVGFDSQINFLEMLHQL